MGGYLNVEGSEQLAMNWLFGKHFNDAVKWGGRGYHASTLLAWKDPIGG